MLLRFEIQGDMVIGFGLDQSTERDSRRGDHRQRSIYRSMSFLQDHGGLPHALPLAGRYGTKFKYQKQVGGRIQSTLLLYGL
ncbi:hypothetical protein V6N11_006513 [Hibiscus sabdariffa]|uniref:Uncharacterized protein n=1 Tax=Hibiscus sabdariffa TaxID=183260 RepID=A0ABR2RR56_9ROSI